MRPRNYIVILFKVVVLLLLLIFFIKGLKFLLVENFELAIPEKIFDYLHMLTIAPAYGYWVSEAQKIKKLNNESL